MNFSTGGKKSGGSSSLRLLTTATLFLSLGIQAADAQSLYKYRDENGQWQFTDRPPADAGAQVERETLSPSYTQPTVTLRRIDVDEGVIVEASNDYACPVQLVLELNDARNVARTTPDAIDAVLPANSTTEVLTIRPRDVEQSFSYRIAYQYLTGDPEARHAPEEPYRVPFAVGDVYPVTQAFPSRVTHADPGSEHAVDIALPVGTAIYAARSGTVVEITYDSYSGGTAAADLPKANLVRISHDDGTLAVYAHLAWNSIRVRPGQRIARGEYIADSGNTGFSSGPHLHFVVQRNAGLRLVSVPVSFAGPPGISVAARTGEQLTAY